MHCVKSVRIRSYSVPHFPAFGLRIQSECGKIQTRKTPNTNIFTQCWKRAIDKDNCISGFFMDLSKAFDTSYHDLMIPKLKAYAFFKESLKNRKRKVQILTISLI